MSRRVVKVPLSVSGIENAIKAVDEYQRWIESRKQILLQRLAELGATSASLGFSRAAYSGLKDATVSVEPTDRGYVIKAEGESVLFIEFGAGIKYGSGHPEAAQYGMGPGTYPDGKGHWDNPHGWWLPKERGGGHTYGNAPAMPMYNARKTIEQELERIVREVFA